MAWIESHQDLEEHPKLLDLCNKTGWNIDEAIGKLHRLWWWALKYAEDGDLSKYDPSQFLVRLNSKLSSKDLYKILQESNFIEKNGLIHDWWDYAGRYLTAKYRTANPKKLREIEIKYKSVKRPTKVGLKSVHQPNQPNQPNITPQEEIYNYYAKIIKPGAKEDAIRSITKLLKTGVSKKDLLARIDAYAEKLKKNKSDPQYYIQANNFFGRAARYKDFEPIVIKTHKPKPDPNCDICQGSGRIPEGQQKGAQCLCVK